MKYKNSENILPPKILEEVQKYVQGELIYVPINKVKRAEWGEKSGTRKYLIQRNKEICSRYRNGDTI